jgi:hypothetical protein
MFILSLIGSYSIIFAACIGLIRFKKIHKSYKPFIFICIVSLVNELISLLCAYIFRNNNFNYNLYGLVEIFLYLWLFREWGHLRKKYSYLAAFIFFTVLWIYDNIILHTLQEANYLFFIACSFCLIFLSLDEINKIVMNHRGRLLRNSAFLICTGIVIFYSYTVTIEVFYLFKLNFNNSFYANTYMVLEVVNFLVNLVFALALLWAPEKLRFILPF